VRQPYELALSRKKRNPMKNLIAIQVVLALTLAGSAFADEWQRNTFPSSKYKQSAEYAPGTGWSHTERSMDISVSPLDPDFRVMLENEWTAVYTEDGLNYKPLRMPHIGTAGCSAQSVEFSRYDEDTLYLRLAHDYWRNMDASKSPAGLWRSTDRGETWEHLYQPPARGYEYNSGDNAGHTSILEDPTRPNHLYFASTSEGLQRSTDNGATWSSAVPALANRRIKTVRAVAAGNETYLYTIAEKKMPRHIPGQRVPLHFNSAPTDYDARWQFERNVNDSSGNGKGLSGSVSGWTESTSEGGNAALFNGSSSLNSSNLTYTGTQEVLSVSVWVQTESSATQTIISYDRNKFWELGTRNGHIIWTVRDSGGTVNELQGPRIDDGDWHHVGAVFESGSMRLYIDGEEVEQRNTGTNRLGSANTATGVVGAGFTGALDDVRIYNSRALNLVGAQQLYLEYDGKNSIPQGQLWRIRVNASGNIAEAVRVQASLADFHDVEVHPLDPSKGWVIRKSTHFSYPFGGRELNRFSNFGNTLSSAPSSTNLENWTTYDRILINPANTNHVFLACGGRIRQAMRWSMDGGSTWNGLDRNVNGNIPSINSFTPMDHKTFATGLEEDQDMVFQGSPFSFVPGSPEMLLYINPKQGGMLQSDDYGATWRTRGAGGPNKDLGQIAVAPSNPDHWAIGLYEHGWSVTTDNGLSWTAETYQNNTVLKDLSEQADASTWWTGARVASGIAFHPTNPDIMVGTWSTKGYILRSTNAGRTWKYTNFRNPMDQFVDVFWSRTDASRVYAGRLRSDDAGKTWDEDITKVVIAVSDSDSDLIIGVDDKRQVTNASLDMYFSIDGGDSWTSLPDPPRERVPGTNKNWLVTGTGRKWNTMADALVAIDPGSDTASLRILLAGRSGIYEYNTNAPTDGWAVHSTGLENNRHLSQSEQVPWMGFVAFDPRPGYSHIVYAASQNDGATQGAWAEEGNPNRAYPGGENSDPYYRSVDGGLTWEHLHGDNYPDAPGGGQIESMVVDTRGRMFAATTEGIYTFSAASGTLMVGERILIDFGVSDQTTGIDSNSQHWNNVSDIRFNGATDLEHLLALDAGGFLIDSTGVNAGVTFSAARVGDAQRVRIGGSAVDFTGTLATNPSGTSYDALAFGDSLYISDNSNATPDLYQVTIGGLDDALSYDFTFLSAFDGGSGNGNIYAELATGSTAGSSIVHAGFADNASNENAWFQLKDVTPSNGQVVINFYSDQGNNGRLNTMEFSVVNATPVFASDPVVMPKATVGMAYGGTLAGSATDPNNVDMVSYAKVSGPAWLNVAANGVLSGLPTAANLGSNSWIIEAFDGNGGTSQATLNVSVKALGLGAGFTSAEGYVDGELVGQLGWSGAAGTFSVDTNLPGSVAISDANPWAGVSYGLSLSGGIDTLFTHGTSLRFTESAAAASSAQNFMGIAFSGTDNSNTSLSFRRLADGTYRLSFYENSGENSWRTGGLLTAADLGTSNEPGSVSDQLYLQLSLTKGATAADWTADCALYNLTVDPGMQTPMGAFQFSFASSADFFNNPLTLIINSAAQAAANITDLRLEAVEFLMTVVDQPLVAYALWASDHEVGAIDEDSDGDGLSNLVEYALGGNPAGGDNSDMLPSLVKTEDGWHYVYRCRLDPGAAGLSYTVETTTDLAAGWTQAGTWKIAVDVINVEFMSVTNAVETTDKPELFIRLKIEGE
jgi:hypothetical protein